MLSRTLKALKPALAWIARPNAELTGRRRDGALAARQMMNHTAKRPGRHAVGGPVERRVRPQSVRRGGDHGCLVLPGRLTDKDLDVGQIALGGLQRPRFGLRVLADKATAE